MLTKTLGQEFETNILNIENLEGKMVLYFVDKNNPISNCGMLQVKIGCLKVYSTLGRLCNIRSQSTQWS